MDQLYWPLTILSRSIHYKNLTGASQHVGLSQPQLSRIIKQLEEETGLSLLDRSSPRHSSWTPEARKLAEIFVNSERSLSASLQNFLESTEQKEVHIGCLEGLSALAQKFAAHSIKKAGVETVFLNIYDLNLLESKFLSADLDIIFSSRAPGSRKYKYNETIGYQVFQPMSDKRLDLNIMSPFEFNEKQRKSKKAGSRLLISNSMQVRKDFLAQFGGSSSFPGPVQSGKPSKNAVSVIVVAQDHFSSKIWDCL